jgi:hypothetical protein
MKEAKTFELAMLPTLAITRAKTCEITMLPIGGLRCVNFEKSKNAKHEQLFAMKDTFTRQRTQAQNG